MNNKEKALMKKWVVCWQSASVKLAKIRQEQIRNTDTQLAIENLDDAFTSAISKFSPSASSGLVEQQKLFRRFKQ